MCRQFGQQRGEQLHVDVTNALQKGGNFSRGIEGRLGAHGDIQL